MSRALAVRELPLEPPHAHAGGGPERSLWR
jgi:hypothetical protein